MKDIDLTQGKPSYRRPFNITSTSGLHAIQTFAIVSVISGFVVAGHKRYGKVTVSALEPEVLGWVKAARQTLAGEEPDIGIGDQCRKAEYRKAAEQGDADAQFNLGEMYSRIVETRKDEQAKLKAEAARWYQKAAEQGHVEAQHCRCRRRFDPGCRKSLPHPANVPAVSGTGLQRF